MSADRILSQILGSGAGSGFVGGLAGGLASGLLTSRSGRKLGKQALPVGGIAAVGGLAYAARSRYRQERADDNRSMPGEGAVVSGGDLVAAGFVPAADRSREAEQLGITLRKAMVAAAQADGRLDGQERHAIYEPVGSLPLSEPEKAELLAQLVSPVDMNELVAAARTPALAAEIYTASLLAIDVDTAAERAYLAMLAAPMGLPEALIESIHRELATHGAGERVSAAPQQAAL